ncbi:hypothetical protein [Sphingobacterium multivorum]|uniref:hypothetical protein n=1 Tax=Sphingobacterium multivorum TaxID=28454 RepID=UPI0028A58A9B|nr:hypothetical protein [Sphingobacterium multivorum]
MYSDFHFFIDFNPNHWFDKGKLYFDELNKIVGLVRQHKCNLYYCKEQLLEFVSFCKDLDEDFITSTGNIIELIIQDANSIRATDSYFFKLQFNKEGSYIQPIHDLYLKSLINEKKLGLLSVYCEEGIQYYLKANSNEEFEKLSLLFFNSVDSIVEWLVNCGEKRTFNLSPKHGQNGIGNWPGESSLLCSSEQAQVLLNKAIGDFVNLKRLFFFDESTNTYIEFFFEGNNPQKSWHGFHLKKEDWDKRVPSSIRKYFAI